MVWANGVDATIVEAAQKDHLAGINNRVWLIFNEPDVINQAGGVLIGDSIFYDSPELVAARYMEIYTLIKDNDPNSTVFVGGMSGLNISHTHWWWASFVQYLTEHNSKYMIEGVHVHAYPVWSLGVRPSWNDWNTQDLTNSLDQWYTLYHKGFGLEEVPIWITEAGAGPYCNVWDRWDGEGLQEVNDKIMTPLLEWYAFQEHYTGLFWFFTYGTYEIPLWWCDFLVYDHKGTLELTVLGDTFTFWNHTIDSMRQMP